MQQSLAGDKLIMKLVILNNVNNGRGLKKRFGAFMPVKK